MSIHYPFAPMPLPYENTGLLPSFDPDTLYFHHDKIYSFYVNMLNYLVSSYSQLHSLCLKDLLTSDLHLPVAVENQIQFYAGGIFNHDLYFTGMCSKPTGQPAGKLKEAIAAEYGSLDNFKKLFKQACFHVLGCGWVWPATYIFKSPRITSRPPWSRLPPSWASTSGSTLIFCGILPSWGLMWMAGLNGSAGRRRGTGMKAA